MNKNTSYLLNKLLQLIVALLGLISAHDSYAVSCFPLNGEPFRYEHVIDFNSNQNYVGYETPWQELSRGGDYYASPSCTVFDNDPMYFSLSAGAGLISAGSSNDANWFDLPGNDYLQLAMQVFIGGNVNEYVSIPQKAYSNECDRCGPAFASGSKIKIKLRVKKKFVGKSFVFNREVGRIYAGSKRDDTPTVPLAIIKLTATMTVPQSCVFDVGDVIEFDFGKISTNAFSGVGAGNRAQGVNTMTKNIGIECKSIDAQQMLSARVETNNPNNNILVSNNPDVGFQIADKDERILRPNDITSFIPFRLDENGRSNFILNAWPVSVTGNKPAAGPVNAAGYVRIDFQ